MRTQFVFCASIATLVPSNDDLEAVVQVEFGQNAVDVATHGGVLQHEPLCDLLVQHLPRAGHY